MPMATDHTSPRVLVSVPNEMEATAIVHALVDRGILARTIGGWTSGLRAMAPGEVSVVVGEADLARAEEVLAEIRSGSAEIDWSTVDFQDGQSPPNQQDHLTSTDRQPESGGRGTAAQPPYGRLQFSIRTLLALQIVVGVAFGIWRGFHAGPSRAMVAFVETYSILVAATFILIVAGTVRVASDLDRTRQVWAYTGRALVVGLVVAVLLTAVRMIL
jgi:hypothetical protein